MLLLLFLLSGCDVLSEENFCEGILLMGGPSTGEGRDLCWHLNGWSRYWGKRGVCENILLMNGPGIGGREVSVKTSY